MNKAWEEGGSGEGTTSNTLKTDKTWQMLSWPVLPRYQKFCTLRPLVLLIRFIFRRRWIQNY